MKNNTKIRLHLSKNLFETIAKEVLAEAKKNDMSGGAYTEAVKMPKATVKKGAEMKSTDKMKKMEEMEVNVAEESTLNEMDPSMVDWSAVAAGLAGIGASAALIDKLHSWWEKKHPESFKKAQDLSRHIDKTIGGNEPGQGHGVKTGKFETTSLNELRKQVKK